MNYTIVISSTAIEDITITLNYYQTINSELAKKFLFRIREAKNHLVLSPLGFQIKYRNVRKLLLKQFPYHILCIVQENKSQIIVLAVIHSYKNPIDLQEQ